MDKLKITNICKCLSWDVFKDNNNGYVYGVEWEYNEGFIYDILWFKTEKEQDNLIKELKGGIKE